MNELIGARVRVKATGEEAKITHVLDAFDDIRVEFWDKRVWYFQRHQLEILDPIEPCANALDAS